MAGSGRGGREGRRERRRRERGGSRGRRRLGRRAGPRSLARATGRTGPGRQCAFVYVARAAAANIHLKSPRVSARQRPAAQSPSRRAPQTPGRRSLWYISDLTSRAGPILRWEPFRVHLGSQLGFFFFSLFRKRCDLSTQVCAAHRASTSHLTSPPPPSPPANPRAAAAVLQLTGGGGCNKSPSGRGPRRGPGSQHLESHKTGRAWQHANLAHPQLPPPLAEASTDVP